MPLGIVHFRNKFNHKCLVSVVFAQNILIQPVEMVHVVLMLLKHR